MTATQQPAGEKVLIIEDDPVNRELLAGYLRGIGYQPLLADNGLKGLMLFDLEEPKLVICDWLMPGRDGLQVCRELRARCGDLLPYIIMLTVRTRTEQLLEAFDAGVDDFLTKPFEHAELLARLRAGVRTINLYQKCKEETANARQANRELQRLNGELKVLVAVDDLTGVFNRRTAMIRLEEAIAYATRYDQPLSCVMLDIDGLKQINDELGHLKGDELLQKIGRALSEIVREVDSVCRIGGDEFLILLPNQALSGATSCVERCRAGIAQRVTIAGNSSGPVTFSAGVAALTPEISGPDELVRVADAALYRAKRSGKNVVIAA